MVLPVLLILSKLTANVPVSTPASAPAASLAEIDTVKVSSLLLMFTVSVSGVPNI